MTKVISKGSKKPPRGGKVAKRDSATGKFVLGRAAFGSISSIEGITLSRAMHRDFVRTEGMPAAKRRSQLATKYGKK